MSKINNNQVKNKGGAFSIGRYRGYYVAIPSFQEKRVVAYGRKAESVYKKSAERGVDNPVVVYVPKKDTALVY